jgi:hypothetical protein
VDAGKVILAGAPMYVSRPLILKSHVTLSVSVVTTRSAGGEAWLIGPDTEAINP